MVSSLSATTGCEQPQLQLLADGFCRGNVPSPAPPAEQRDSRGALSVGRGLGELGVQSSQCSCGSERLLSEPARGVCHSTKSFAFPWKWWCLRGSAVWLGRDLFGSTKGKQLPWLRGFTSIVLSRCQLVPLKPMGLSLRLSIDQSKTLRKL